MVVSNPDELLKVKSTNFASFPSTAEQATGEIQRRRAWHGTENPERILGR
jgi:hypothetical protein